MYHGVSTGIFRNTGHCYHHPAQSSHFTCAEYNALIIEPLSILEKKILETGNICNKRS